MLLKDLHPLMEYVHQHPQMGALFIFLVAFAESLPIIGTIIPGTITMTAVGFLIGTGTLPGVLSLFIASIAALIGDAIGFWIGYYYNERLRLMWPFKKHPKWLSISENFFNRHGGKSIIIGRFVGPARSTVPLIAGLLRVTWLRFFIAAIPSAALWALVYTLPGIMLGALSREVPAGKTTEFLLYGVITLAVVWLIFWFIEHFFIQLKRFINHFTKVLWQKLNNHSSTKWFIEGITNQRVANDYTQLTVCLFGVITLILFLVLFFNVRAQSWIVDGNAPIFYLLQSIHHVALTNVMVVITLMSAPKTIVLFSALIVLALLFKKQFRAAIHLGLLLVITVCFAYFFKVFSHSVRPQGLTHLASTFSFPSGHTTLSLVTLGFITYLFLALSPFKNRWIVLTTSISFLTAVAFSRLYLGAHWLTDIVGSVLLGLSLLFFCIVSYKRYPHSHSSLTLSTKQLLSMVSASLIIAWIIQVFPHYHRTQQDYQPYWPVVSVNREAWWAHPLKYAPIYRQNRLGENFQPFNIQWLGSLSSIEKALTQAHWRPLKDQHGLKNQLQRFASFDPEYHMPILPWLYHNRPPALIMIKHLPQENMMLEVRFWQSDIDIPNSKHPLWLAATDIRYSPKVLLSLRHHSKVMLGEHVGINQLVNDTRNLDHKFIQALPMKQAFNTLQWDGRILLIAHNQL